MKKAELRAYRTLVQIRIRRQEALDKRRVAAQTELKRLIALDEEAKQAVETAAAAVSAQVGVIDQLMQSGKHFQIADYLAQQDYRTTLEARVDSERGKQAQAQAVAEQQQEVLRQAKAECARNMSQRERLEERIRRIKTAIEVKQMDDEDEEAEEAVVTRKLIQVKNQVRDAALDDEAASEALHV